MSLEVISVCVNSMSHDFERSISVADLVQKMGLGGKRVALELNGEIVPRSRFPQQMLSQGDNIEIVVAVGGG